MNSPYAYNSPNHEDYKLVVSYRFCLAFIIGYLSWAWFNVIITQLFYTIGLERAESVFLAMLITLIVACIWVISVFSIQSLKKLSFIFLSLFSLITFCRFILMQTQG